MHSHRSDVWSRRHVLERNYIMLCLLQILKDNLILFLNMIRSVSCSRTWAVSSSWTWQDLCPVPEHEERVVFQNMTSCIMFQNMNRSVSCSWTLRSSLKHLCIDCNSLSNRPQHFASYFVFISTTFAQCLSLWLPSWDAMDRTRYPWRPVRKFPDEVTGVWCVLKFSK